MKLLKTYFSLMVFLISALGCTSGWGAEKGSTVPADIQAIFDKPAYANSIWGLRVIDAKTRKAIIDLQPNRNFFIGSVRKLFSIGELLNAVGPAQRYNTPVYRQGTIDNDGVLHGNLILVASGDLTMGGRTNPDGSIAVTDFDHNEADSLGNAMLTKPDPLAGYTSLAQQIAASSVKEIAGDVIIDDRLFKPFNFRDEFDVRPIFVNDDVVDLTINPTSAGNPASVVSRPISAALGVESSLLTSGPGTDSTLALEPEFPQCIGEPGCTAEITGQLPIDFVPPLTGVFPLIQVFRIEQPSNYARTVLIEALQAAGVQVDAPAVAVNPVQLLPSRNSYRPRNKVAELTGLPYSDYAKFILKVSYNIGADTSLVLFGLTRGVNNITAALKAEQRNLGNNYGIPKSEYFFVDGSGGSTTTAKNPAVTRMLADMTKARAFADYFNAIPVMGIDGSLAFVTDFESDNTLAAAKGQVHAKPGTFAEGSSSGLQIKGQAFGGYIDAKSGRRLIYQLVVNEVPVNDLNGLLQIFQDQGTISAMLWRDY
jgi:D-alanyl-D-alanine carboxypeptidase